MADWSSVVGNIYGNIEWAMPWAWLLLPLPLALRALPPWRAPAKAVRIPFLQQLLDATGERPRRGAQILERHPLQNLMILASWILLVAAAARPQWLGEPIVQQQSGRDLMVAVDLSGSMETRDFTTADNRSVDRLSALKHVLGQLAAARNGDRLGLIVFGSGAYLQSPFTEDHSTWLQLLEETEVRMAGPSTRLGDAIGLAIKHFSESDSEHRVLLLLTDGNDTGSMVPPVDAARVAAARGIRIYPIAVGDPATVGEEAIDLDTLDQIATLTGGERFVALDRAALTRILSTLNQLEPVLFETVSFRPRTDLHWLVFALLLVTLPLLRLIHRLTRRPVAGSNTP
ncbi:MAG: VWA domain-containing protein [Halieaceae bacterium]|jgi:Ca-activated chloride channel family protein|nr:VWA domain-containing protein [Halieaceae bacterium]